jgi:putative nucleotidyltransferase with HDIG domain
VAATVVNELPVFPAPRIRALVLLRNPDAGVDDFVSVIEGDPALTAAVLRAANSAASAPVSPVSNARDAIVRIGLKTTSQIASAAILHGQFRDIDATPLDVPEMWRHILATGLLAEAAASREDAPMAFTAGLLHDIGRLALASAKPHLYEQVVDRVRLGIEAEEVERALLGTGHSAWGSELAAGWGLPEAISAAIAAHHEPGQSGVARAVYEGRSLAWSVGIGDGLSQPKEMTFPETDRASRLLDAVGGIEGLMGRIRWFRESCSPRPWSPGG